MLKAERFSYGDMTSVAVSNGLVAVSVQAEDYAAKGRVAVFKAEGDSLELVSIFETGVQPDMLTFTPDGTKILVANEGEPRRGNKGIDPRGSVTIIELNTPNISKSEAKTIGFGAYDGRREALVGSGVVLRKGAKPSADFEPEYIAVSGDGKTAYIALQEANSIAVMDVDKGAFTSILPLGVKDYGKESNALDLIDDGEVSIVPHPGIYGLYLPDGISVYETGGKTYLLTANEGDSRSDWEGLDDEVESESSPTGEAAMPEEVVWYNAALYDGLDQDKAYIFGGRSFSVWELGTSGGVEQVFDSGSAFERLTAGVLNRNFNSSNDDISLDDRSAKKGVEPEYVITGKVGERVYAFIGLERIGGVMVYDITSIDNIKLANYINSREFGADIRGDVAPEGLCFIPADESVTGKALLLAACEVSGTVAVFEIE